jgi:hypothetical protein
VGFVVDKVAMGQDFLPEYFSLPLSMSFHRCSITRKNEKKIITFIAGLHNKPQGCGASVASAAGFFTTKKSIDVLSFITQSAHQSPYLLYYNYITLSYICFFQNMTNIEYMRTCDSCITSNLQEKLKKGLKENSPA